MKIVYICCDFGVPVFGYKGASIHVREMVNAFRKAGHDVLLISPAMHRGKEDEKGSNMGEEGRHVTEPFTIVTPPAEAGLDLPAGAGSLTCLSVLPKPHHLQVIQELRELDTFLGLNTRIRHELRNLFYNMTVNDAILDYLRDQQVDFIYERYTLFSHVGIKIGRTLSVPHILEVNAPLTQEQEKMRGLALKSLASDMERSIWRGTDQVLVVSAQLGEMVQKNGVYTERIRVLPNAIDPQRFQSEKISMNIRKKYELNDMVVAGFVGSLKNWHGTETLLKAFQQLTADLPHLRLLIVGDGPEREKLTQLADAGGIADRVVFTGKVPYGDIPAHLAAMDIAVAPYIPHENFYFSPIKIFEYMAMGIATIGAKIGQVQEIVHNGETGLLFEPGNINQLAHALKTLAQDNRLRERLGNNARTWVLKEHTWDNNAKKVLKIVKEIDRR